MSCTNCNSARCKGNCGCKDAPLCTNNPTTNSDCPTPTPCTECFDMACIYWNGPAIPSLDINPGDTMDEILQKLILLSTNTGCVITGSPCFSPLNVFADMITDTSMQINWDIVLGGVDYEVEYKEAAAVSWLTNPAVLHPTNQDIIGGLTPDTDYHIRVKANCTPPDTCYSIVFQVKTLPTP